MTPDTDDGIAKIVEERNAALTSMDLEFVRKMFPDASNFMLVMVLHKSRYECTGIQANLRHRSREWLQARGLGRMTDTPFLPKNQLPK